MKRDDVLPPELEDAVGQERREWIIQRIAWVGFLLLLIAVALGLFGRGGPLSDVKATSQDGVLQLDYERFMRYHSPDTLHLTVMATSDSTRVLMDSQYAKNIQIERITPEPEREISEEGIVAFVFNTRPNTSLLVTFHFAPQKYGSMDGWIAVADGPRVAISHFVYP